MGSIKVLLAGVAFIVSANISYGQEKTAEERAAAQTEHMATSLGLSAEQKSQVAELNMGVVQKNEAVKQNPNMTQEQKAEAIKGNNEGGKNMLRTILTPEQFTKYEQQEASKKHTLDKKKTISQKKRKVQIQEAPVKE
jgi:hypothetical protein